MLQKIVSNILLCLFTLMLVGETTSVFMDKGQSMCFVDLKGLEMETEQSETEKSEKGSETSEFSDDLFFNNFLSLSTFHSLMFLSSHSNLFLSSEFKKIIYTPPKALHS